MDSTKIYKSLYKAVRLPVSESIMFWSRLGRPKGVVVLTHKPQPYSNCPDVSHWNALQIIVNAPSFFTYVKYVVM